MIGDKRKYCVALVTLDADEVAALGERRGRSSTGRPRRWRPTRPCASWSRARSPQVNGQLASFESVK